MESVSNVSGSQFPPLILSATLSGPIKMLLVFGVEQGRRRSVGCLMGAHKAEASTLGCFGSCSGDLRVHVCLKRWLVGSAALAAVKWDRSQRVFSVCSCRYNFPWIHCVCCCRKNPWPVERRLPAQRDIKQGEQLVEHEKMEICLLYIMFFMFSLHPGTGDVSGSF